ncbi:helix-turn-helix transcriptional regulator [Nocardia sp. NPDC004604]|uniref:helix-turn-helix domain-containing protein n=1 Tax=Nocardia sp. NPDC004604 TaxID=3157013 RepID=UPI0033B3C896
MDPRKYERLGLDLARQQTKLIRELKAVRMANGFSVADVADAMGVDEAVVYRFEKGGTNPTIATIRRYAISVGAMLQLGAAAVAVHESQRIRAAATSIDHDPAKRAEFIEFHEWPAAGKCDRTTSPAPTAHTTWTVDKRE